MTQTAENLVAWGLNAMAVAQLPDQAPRLGDAQPVAGAPLETVLDGERALAGIDVRIAVEAQGCGRAEEAEATRTSATGAWRNDTRRG